MPNFHHQENGSRAREKGYRRYKDMGVRYETSLLVDPAVLSLLVLNDLLWLEPEGNLFLSRLNGVRAVADVAAHVLLIV